MPPAGRTPKCPGKPVRTMDERLCVVLHLGGGCILHNTLVDTGAARTVMGHDKWTDYCSRNGIPNYLRPCARLRTLTGEELPTLGEGQVTIESVFIDVIVVPVLSHDLILGDDALRKLHAYLDLGGNTVTLNSQVYSCVTLPVSTVSLESAADAWRREFPVLFGQENPLGCHTDVQFKMKLVNPTPINQRPYRAPLLKRKLIEEEVDRMLEQGVIRPSTSPWASPITLQPKKDGTLRFCVDYRKLNAVTRKDAHPLPRIQDIFDSLTGSTLYTVCDLRAGFNQIPVHPETTPYTAFVTHHGLWECLRMPFGLCNAPGVFQRTMQETLGPHLGKCAMVYLDDVIIYSPDAATHQTDVRNVLGALASKGFTLKASKCTFSEPRLKLLGYVVSGDGISPDPDKVCAIQDMDPPEDVSALRRFLGMAGYYRQLIPDFAHYAAPLTALLKARTAYVWNADCQTAFEHLKDSLTCDSVMAYPRLNKPYLLYTDASNFAVGAVLVQTDENGIERPVQYISKMLNSTQRRWSAIEREAFAVVYALQTLRPYLYGAQFTILTDHKPLKSLFLNEIKNTKIQRWAMLIAEYGMPIEHRSGKNNVRADMLSRLSHDDHVSQPVMSVDVSAPVEHRDANSLTAAVTACGLDPDNVRSAQRNAGYIDFLPDDDVLIHEGFVCTLRAPRDQAEYPRLYLPPCCRSQAIRACHKEIGHHGDRKTLARVQRTFKWSRMWPDVQSELNRCAICQINKQKRQYPPPTDMPIAHYPGQMVAMDLVGPLIVSHNDNKYLITTLDHASGWLDAHPIAAKTQKAVYDYFVNHHVPRYGPPEILLTDQGVEFKGQDLAGYLRHVGTEHRRTTPYHPQTNGRIERAHRTLKSIIRKLINNRTTDWEDRLGAALWAHRITVSDTTQFSPYFLQYGREPRLPLSRLLCPPSTVEADAVYRHDILTDAFCDAARNTADSRKYNRRRLQERANAHDVRVGDHVVVSAQERAPMDSHWDYGYIVVAVRGSVVTIVHQATGRRRTLNRDKLRIVDPSLQWDDVNPRVPRTQRHRARSEARPPPPYGVSLPPSASPVSTPAPPDAPQPHPASPPLSPAPAPHAPVVSRPSTPMQVDPSPVRRSARLAEKRSAIPTLEDQIAEKRRCIECAALFCYSSPSSH